MFRNKLTFLVLMILMLAPVALMAYPLVGDTAPNFTLPDTAGISHSLANYRGRVVELQFWQSTCPTCLAELPRVSVMWDDYYALGFDALAINLGESNNTVKVYARQNHQTFLLDASMSVWALYKINGYIPLNYVIDTAGVVLYEAEGFNEAAIRAVIEANLPMPGINEGTIGQTLRITSVEPNPTRGPVVIRFASAYPGAVTAQIYSASGQLVRTLKGAGQTGITWNLRDDSGRRVTNGVYVCQFNNVRVRISILR